MATRTSHHHRHDRRPNLIINPVNSDELFGSGSFEMNKSDVWNKNDDNDDHAKPVLVASSRKLQSDAHDQRKLIGKSLPVNVPDRSKILRIDECKHDDEDEDEDDEEDEGDWLPPHEYLARTRMASFSVHEGVGRTLKGRDLSRVRNAVWKKTGFEQD